MSEIFPKDIFYRFGGRTAVRYGLGSVAGAYHGPVEVVESFSRTDASPCATAIDRDGIPHVAAANKLRSEWVDLDGDGIRETATILFEGGRTNTILQSQTFATTWTTNLLTATNGAGIGPDGTTSASSLIPTAVNSNSHYAIQTITITANESLGIAIDVK